MKKIVSILLAVCMLAGLTALCAWAEEPGDPYAPPANLNELSKQEQLACFNLAVNRVRAQRPGFAQRERMRIEDMHFNGLNAALMPLINAIIADLMPGDWVSKTIANGQDNIGLFLSDNANASDLTPQDVTSIQSIKLDDNWVIKVAIAEVVNPPLGRASSIGRIAPIATRQQVIDELTASGVSANPADATLRYHSGYVSVTVNPEGKVFSAELGYKALAEARNVVISILSTDISATQSAIWQYAAFDWTDNPIPLPDDAPPAVHPPAPKPWYSYLPSWFQFILRYILFGWLWMQ